MDWLNVANVALAQAGKYLQKMGDAKEAGKLKAQLNNHQKDLADVIQKAQVRRSF